MGEIPPIVGMTNRRNDKTNLFYELETNQPETSKPQLFFQKYSTL